MKKEFLFEDNKIAITDVVEEKAQEEVNTEVTEKKTRTRKTKKETEKND